MIFTRTFMFQIKKKTRMRPTGELWAVLDDIINC